jgi:DNA polymerase III subunit delta
MGATTRPPRVPFLVSYGAEDFFLDREIGRARKWPKREVILLDGEDVTERELVRSLETPADGSKTVILDNAQKVKTGKLLKAFVDESTPNDLSTILFAVVRSEKLPAGWQHVAQKGDSSEAKKFKSWETRDLFTWINGEAATHNVQFAPGVDQVFLKYVDVDLYRLSNEIRKLAIYVGPNGTITREHVDLIVSRTPSATQFQVAEMAIAKNAIGAMNAFSILYRNEGDSCLLPTASALMKQVERALIVRRSFDRGVDAGIASASVGLDATKFPFKQLSSAVKKHTSPDLVKHMTRLSKLDADVKGPASSKRTLVELAVLAIAS